MIWFQNMLQNVKIYLIIKIIGEVDQVVGAYLSGRLNDPQFYMLGVLYAWIQS